MSAVIAAHVLKNVYHVSGEGPDGLGMYGVYIFFLISGFIITSLTVQEIQATGSFNQKNFIVRRCLRILPPLFLYAAAMLVLQHSNPRIPWWAARAVVFSCDIGAPCGWIFGHTWSLAFEEQFYLLFPFLVVRQLNPLVIPVIFLYLLPLFFPIRFVGSIGFLEIAALFALGASYAVHYEKINAFLLNRAVLILSVLLATMLMFWWLIPPRCRTVDRSEIRADSTDIFSRSCSLFLLRLAIFRTFLSNPVFARIGLYSYSIYLWQEYFFRPGAGDDIMDVFIAIAATLVISAVSYHTFEQVFRTISRRFHWSSSLEARALSH